MHICTVQMCMGSTMQHIAGIARGGNLESCCWVEGSRTPCELGQPDGSPHPVSKLDCLSVQVTDLVL